MHKSYEATNENGQNIWLSEQLENTSAKDIVTIIEETKSQIKLWFPEPDMVGKVKI